MLYCSVVIVNGCVKVSVVPLVLTIPCGKLTLMTEGLWGVVNESERAPPEEEAEKLSKFVTRRDRALALIEVSVDLTILYLPGDPEDPVAVWKKLSDQFQNGKINLS